MSSSDICASLGQLEGRDPVQLAANWVILDAALNLLDGGRHPQVQAEVRQVLAAELSAWLRTNSTKGSASSRKQAADLITAYLKDPTSVKLRALLPIPPGAPI